MNIAQKFDFMNWRHIQTENDHQYKTVTIEAPANWNYVYLPGLNLSHGPNPDHTDYWLIPQSLHRDDCMVISAGWRIWQAGYKQRVSVKAGQRYTLVAELQADFAVDPPRAAAIEWRCVVEGSLPAAPDWSSYATYEQRGRRVSVQTVFVPQADGIVDLVFWARSLYADNSCDLYLYDIRCEEVAPDYGNNTVIKMNPFGTVDPVPEPEPIPEPTPDPDPEPQPTIQPAAFLVLLLGGVGGILALLFVLFVRTGITPVFKGFSAMSTTIIPIEGAANLLLAAIAAMISGPLLASPAVVLLTALLKRFIPAPSTSIAFGAALVLTVLIWVARAAGLGVQFDNLFELVNTAAPAILGLIATLFGSNALYQAAQKRDIPFISYSRSQDVVRQALRE